MGCVSSANSQSQFNEDLNPYTKWRTEQQEIRSVPTAIKSGAESCRIMFIGYRGSGKTSLIQSLVHGYGVNTRSMTTTSKSFVPLAAPTRNISCHQVQYHGEPITLIDTPGLPSERSLSMLALAFVTGVVWVIDCSRPDQFDAISQEMETLVTLFPSALQLPIYFVFSKHDAAAPNSPRATQLISLFPIKRMLGYSLSLQSERAIIFSLLDGHAVAHTRGLLDALLSKCHQKQAGNGDSVVLFQKTGSALRISATSGVPSSPPPFSPPVISVKRPIDSFTNITPLVAGNSSSLAASSHDDTADNHVETLSPSEAANASIAVTPPPTITVTHHHQPQNKRGSRSSIHHHVATM